MNLLDSFKYIMCKAFLNRSNKNQGRQCVTCVTNVNIGFCSIIECIFQNNKSKMIDHFVPKYCKYIYNY